MNRRKNFLPAVFLALIAARALAETNAVDARFPPRLLAFSAAKEQQARQLAARLSLEVPPEVWLYFKQAGQGDWPAMGRTFARLMLLDSVGFGSASPAGTPAWPPAAEVEMAYEAFAAGGPHYPLAFGGGIIAAVAPGAIYFGGTDAGRGVVTALCRSHAQADPFFTLTQNALADGTYLEYLRQMYGGKIYLPSRAEVQTVFTETVADARRRYEHDQKFPDEPRQLRPGETAHVTEDGEFQLTGPTAARDINARLAQKVFEGNAGRDFFVEEGLPVDWMRPRLVPHGFIFKLARQPLPALPVQTLDADRAFWTNACQEMLGTWLRPKTPLADVCAFAEAAHGAQDTTLFGGDLAFVTNTFATRAFSKLRVSIAGLYQWRLASPDDTSDKNRLQAEADFAFRQAFALCPTNQETVFRFVGFLMSEKRPADALRVARTAQRLAPDSPALGTLVAQLKAAAP